MNVLKVARAKHNLSMQKLADMMNVSRQTVWNWENGITAPTVSQIMDLHLKLEIPLDDLMEHFKK